MELRQLKKRNPENGRNLTILDYSADSLTDWIATVDDYAQRYAQDPENVWHHSAIRTGRPDFYGTETLYEARDLMKHGWREGVERMSKNLNALSANVSMPDLTPSYSYDVGGMFPDVAAFCAGEVEHMVTEEPVDSETKSVVHLVIPGSYPALMRVAQLERYGTALLSVLDALQRSGRSVSLEWIKCSEPDEKGKAKQHGLKQPRYVTVRTPIIEEGRALDIASVSFAFHPSMLRRLAFAVCGGRPELEILGDAMGVSTRNVPESCREPGKVYPPGPWQAMSDRKVNDTDTCAQYLHNAIAHQI